MPILLPPEIRTRLLARFEGPEARAFKLVKEVELMKWSPDRWPALFRESWERSADHQRLFLRGRLEAYPAWDQEDAEMIQAWLAFINGQSGPPSDDPAKELAFHQLLGAFYLRFVAAGDAPDPVETMSSLIAATNEARAEYADVDVNGDLNSFLLDCIEVLSVFYEQRNDILKAVAHSDMAVIKAEDFGLGKRAMKNRCRSAKLLFGGSRNIDEALNLVLPIWEVVRDRPPSLDRANLAYTLAQGYAQTGDLTETKHFLEEITGELEALGLRLDPEDPAGTLLSWLDTLPAWEPVANYTFDRFIAAALLHAQYAHLRELSIPLPGGKRLWEKTRELCLDIIGKIQELQQHQEMVDERLIAGEPVPEYSPGEATRIDHAAATFGRWLEEMYVRVEEDDQDEELPGLLHQKLEEKVVREDIINQMLVWQLIGEFHTGRGEKEKSEAALAEAYRLATEANRLEEQLHILKMKVGNYLGPDHGNERLDTCLHAIDLIEEARTGITTPYQRSAFIQDKYDFYALALKISWKLQHLDLMFGLMELVKARDYKDALLREGEEAGELKEILNALHDKTLSAAAETLPATARERQILYDTRLLRARRQRESAEYMAGALPRIMDGVGDGEALLSYCELMGGVWLAQLIANGRILAQEFRTEEAWLYDRIEAFGVELPSGYRGRGMAAFVPKNNKGGAVSKRARQRELAEWLLPPEFRKALAGCRHLRICPHHELHAVPFHALPYEDGYLIEQFAVSYLPNLSCLPLESRDQSPADSVALIGTDTFAEVNGRVLAPLPGALAEVNQLATFYKSVGTSVLNFTGAAARRENLLDPANLDALENSRVVHLAVHGEDLSVESPMDARLFLRDGFIDGFDVSLLHLRAEVVVLSACFAGARARAVRGFEELAADDMFGLQSAFFSAGTRSVLGALWPVDDRAGKTVMVAFHRYLREHGAAEALRLATLEYLRVAPVERRGMVYWGSFFLVEG